MRFGLIATAVIAGWVAGGCDTISKQHNDVLIFGTTTKVALDVSAPVQNGAIPEFTLGYKRNEGVWMPLKPTSPLAQAMAGLEQRVIDEINTCAVSLSPSIQQEMRVTFCALRLLPHDKYVSFAAGIANAKGGAAAEIDTYSVFASFGGRGSLGFSGAGGTMAQFFATGIAAQRLGANPQIAAALNSDGEKPAEEAAKADAEKAKAAQEQAKADAAMAAVAASRAQPQLQADASAASALVAKWTGCPDPGATDRTQYVAAIAFAKGRAPSEVWDRLQEMSDRELILQILQFTQSAREMNAFSEGIDEACKGT